MPVMNTRLLRALSEVKDLRKLLAETDYLRRMRQQQHCEQECASQSRRLAQYRSALPQQRTAILGALAERPVAVREVHDAQAALRKLEHQLNTEQSSHVKLEESYRQACIDREAAQRKYAAATQRHQRFQELKVRDSAFAAEQRNATEQAELEDRPANALPQG